MLSKAAIKDIQSLQQKKFRDLNQEFVAEGPKVVTELLESGAFPLKKLYVLPEWLQETKSSLLTTYRDAIIEVSAAELEKIAHYATPNKVVAVFGKKAPVENIITADKITLVLDDIQDPGNLGTIIRTADWFGIDNIVCSPQTADAYNSKVVQSTMASLARVNLLYTSLPEWLEENNQLPVLAATLSGKSLHQFNRTKEALLIIGNESKGVSASLLKKATHEICIPGAGRAESLNAAIAAGIILYELLG